MVGFIQSQEEKKLLKDIPPDLPILPLRNIVAFPFMILPLAVGVPRSKKLEGGRQMTLEKKGSGNV